MKIKKIALLGLVTALAMIMSYIESFLPLSFAIPGIKMGLANIVIVFVLYRAGFREACLVSVVRAILVSLLFGNVMSLAYSLAGAGLSLAGMGLLKRLDSFSVVGVSVTGAILHNAGQILMAILLLGTEQIAYYFPALATSGVVTGICIGVVAGLVMRRMEKLSF